MKQSMKTIKEERVKLQTFRALRRVNTPQNLKKIGSTSSLCRHGEEKPELGQMLARTRGGRRSADL
jgi:hypothetical protein